MRIFKYQRFSKFANKESITDKELLDLVKLIENGQFDADLGGGVYKVRLARANEGKSGGHRIITYFKNEHRTFFVYGFSKSDRGNISNKELKAFKIDAKEDFDLTEAQLGAWLKIGSLTEIFKEG